MRSGKLEGSKMPSWLTCQTPEANLLRSVTERPGSIGPELLFFFCSSTGTNPPRMAPGGQNEKLLSRWSQPILHAHHEVRTPPSVSTKLLLLLFEALRVSSWARVSAQHCPPHTGTALQSDHSFNPIASVPPPHLRCHCPKAGTSQCPIWMTTAACMFYLPIHFHPLSF